MFNFKPPFNFRIKLKKLPKLNLKRDLNGFNTPEKKKVFTRKIRVVRKASEQIPASNKKNLFGKPEFTRKIVISESLKKRTLRTFSLMGILILAISALYLSKPIAAEVFKQEYAAKKKLPIYSVDIPDKKISISFDAAWGEGLYRL